MLGYSTRQHCLREVLFIRYDFAGEYYHLRCARHYRYFRATEPPPFSISLLMHYTCYFDDFLCIIRVTSATCTLNTASELKECINSCAASTRQLLALISLPGTTTSRNDIVLRAGGYLTPPVREMHRGCGGDSRISRDDDALTIVGIFSR